MMALLSDRFCASQRRAALDWQSWSESGVKRVEDQSRVCSAVWYLGLFVCLGRTGDGGLDSGGDRWIEEGRAENVESGFVLSCNDECETCCETCWECRTAAVAEDGKRRTEHGEKREGGSSAGMVCSLEVCFTFGLDRVRFGRMCMVSRDVYVTWWCSFSS